MNLDELLKTVWTVEVNNNNQGGPGPNQPSMDLSKKTVEEVWQDIQEEEGQNRNSLDRKATLGEITLEDFLVKAGVVAESAEGKKNPIGQPQKAQWVNYQQNEGPVFMPGHQQPITVTIAEKSVERRHKRMIKNRESAARSRARKQAYTHELENKVSLLEEENERLKRRKELEMVLPSIPTPEPKYQLRRTSSALI